MIKCTKQFCARLMSEFLASLFVQFFGCSVSSILSSTSNIGDKIVTTYDSIAYAMGWGGSVLTVTQVFRIVSGAQINPCITIASMIVLNLDPWEGALYIMCQIFGSGLGFIIAYYIYQDGNEVYLFCCTRVLIDPWWKSIFMEIYATGAWVLAACSSWHISTLEVQESMSLRIGFVVILATAMSAPYTMSGMNPLRTLWPALAAKYWDRIYIYLAVPPITAALLGGAWRFLYLQDKDETYVTVDGPAAEFDEA